MIQVSQTPAPALFIIHSDTGSVNSPVFEFVMEAHRHVPQRATEHIISACLLHVHVKGLSHWSLKFQTESRESTKKKKNRSIHHGWNGVAGGLPTGPVLLSSGVPLPASRPDLAHQSVPLLAPVTPHQAGEPQPWVPASNTPVWWICVYVCSFGPWGRFRLYQHSPRWGWHLQITV